MVDSLSPGLLERLPEPPRKVVLVRPARLGDFICATPAFRALRAAQPLAEISIIALPMLHDLAVRLPCFDRYLAFPGFPGIASSSSMPGEPRISSRQCRPISSTWRYKCMDRASIPAPSP